MRDVAPSREALGEVVDALKSYPSSNRLSAWPSERPRSPCAAQARPRDGGVAGRTWDFPSGLQVLAATLALAVTGVVFLAAWPSSRVKERTINAGAYLWERKDRVVEDFRLLRVVVSTAFEGRLDQ